MNDREYWYRGRGSFPNGVDNGGITSFASVNKFYVGSTPTYWIHAQRNTPYKTVASNYPAQGGAPKADVRIGGSGMWATQLSNPMTYAENTPISATTDSVDIRGVDFATPRNAPKTPLGGPIPTRIGRGRGTGIIKKNTTYNLPIVGGKVMSFTPRTATIAGRRLTEEELRQSLRTQQRNASLGITTARRTTALRE